MAPKITVNGRRVGEYGGYDALVYQDGGTVTAENRHGATISSSDDAATVLQAAITPGGTVLVDAGEYVLEATQTPDFSFAYSVCLIVPPSKTTRLIGAGSGATTLKLADGQNAVDRGALMIMATGQKAGGVYGPTYDGLEIAGMTLDGNKANQTLGPIWIDGSGLILTGGKRAGTVYDRYGLHLHDLEMKNSQAAAVYCGNNSGGVENFALLDHLYVHDCGARAIEIDFTDHVTARNILTHNNGEDYASAAFTGIIAHNNPATLGARTMADRLVLENVTTYDRLYLKNLQRPVVRGLYSDTTAITDAANVCGVNLYRCYEAVVEVDYVAAPTVGIWAHSYVPEGGSALTVPVAYIHNRGLIVAATPVKADYGAFVHLDGGEIRGIPDATCYGFYVDAAGNHCSNVYFGTDLDYLIAGGTGSTTLTGCRSAAALPSSGTIVNCGGNVNFKLQATGTSTGTGSEQTIAHGLRAAPTRVSVTPTETGATVSAVWADATNLHATVTSGKAYVWSAEV